MSDLPGAPGTPDPGYGRRRGRRRHRSPEPGSASRLSRTQRRVLAALALVGALLVAVAIPVILASPPPSPATPSAAVPTSTLPGGSVTALATSRPTLPGGTSPPTPAATGAPRSPAASGAPSLPPGGTVATRIRIPRLGIDLPIVEGDGIDAPIGKAAHYPGSGWPGGGTNIYIYGHARAGMLLPLWKAEVGDIVTLGLAGGGERSYEVVRVLPKVPWNAMNYLAATPYEILTLQTSTSYYASAPRFVVIAEPVP